eukprot:1769175-Rhodomonas_salina.4
MSTLKAALISAPVLIPYNPNAKTTVLITDASRFASGATLMQGKGDEMRPLSFYSRKVSKAERQYTTSERELLAIKEALRVWRHHTMAVPIEVKTDHDSESLRYIMIKSQPN